MNAYFTLCRGCGTRLERDLHRDGLHTGCIDRRKRLGDR